MSDVLETGRTAEPESSQTGEGKPRSSRRGIGGFLSRDLEENFKRGVFALLSIFIVLAAFGLYFSVGNIIDRWVVDQYIPVVRTIYYIAVIAICIYLIKRYFLKK